MGEIQEKVKPVPDDPDYYEFSGWYLTDSGSDKKGSKLDETMKITGSMNLYADFAKRKDRWSDLTFRDDTRGYGAITGSNIVNVKNGTNWEDVQKPSIRVKRGYQIDGWYTEAGKKMLNGQTVEADQTYTLKCVPEGINPGGLPLQMPDAAGSVAEDGTGRIQIKGTNPAADYTLTDLSGTVLATKTGIQLQQTGAAFTGLTPCTEYSVYETIRSAGLTEGDTIEVLYGGEHSQPTQVVIPALGSSNYQVAADPDDAAAMQLTIQPAAPNVSYAVLDLDGTVIQTDGSGAEGWVQETDGQAVLKKLAPDQLCTVVARGEEDERTPAQKSNLGTQIAIGERTSLSGKRYTIRVLNGAVIDRINDIRQEDGRTAALVKKGDRILLKAPETIGGQTFNRWSFLVGTADGAGLNESTITYNAPEVVMPAGNLVIQAAYRQTETAATSSNAEIRWNRKGSAALDLTENRQNMLLDSLLTGNAEDSSYIDRGVSVRYTIKLREAALKATQSDAVRETLAGENQVETGTVKLPWLISSDLTRMVGSIHLALPDSVEDKLQEGSLPIHIYTEIASGLMGNLDYRLYPYDQESGTVDLENPVLITPDPNLASSDCTGVISFDASVGSSYLMTWLKAWEVTIKDEKQPGESHNNCTIKVKAGQPLSDAEGYDVIEEAWQNPRSGELWDCRGLGENPNPDTPKYRADAPVTKKLTLYMRYQPNREWKEEKAALMKKN